ncbi:MAG TPA: helix-turn-helix domain-containing protein [Pirellulales bacterium]|nr:helix-turn-helix domain-containing protein [Pirellulales bacterium]
MRIHADDDQGPSLSSLQSIDVAVLEQMFDFVPDAAFFVKDGDGRYLVVNKSLIERHGLRHKDQAIGRRPHEICPGKFGRDPSSQDAEVLRLNRPLIDHLEMHWQSPHQPCWCLTTKLPLHDAEGNVVGLIGISRDLRAPIKSQEMPTAAAGALHRFENRLSDPITPAKLASWSGLTTARFARLIKRFFGLTPSQYITKVRITAASVMLRETDRTVADVAAACGFADHSSFTRTFRKTAGISPTRFRETT